MGLFLNFEYSTAHFHAFGLFKRYKVISVQVLHLQLMRMSELLLNSNKPGRHWSHTSHTHHNRDGKSGELAEGTIL